jgi:hypothetical protein
LKQCDGEGVPQLSLDGAEIPGRHRTEQLHGDSVATLPVDAAHGDVRSDIPGSRKPDRERTGAGHAFPCLAAQRVQEMSHRFDETLVSGFGEWKPTSRTDLPVVHPGEPARGERVQYACREAQKSFHLEDLPFPEDRLEGMEERQSATSERLVDEVDIEPRVLLPGFTGLRPGGAPRGAMF